MNDLYVLNNMMCCAPLRATLRSMACAQRYRLANTQRITMGSAIDEHNELDGSPCRSCPTGRENADVLMPVTQRDLVKAHSGLDTRACAECKQDFQPTCRTHRWCFPCGKKRKAAQRLASTQRKKAAAAG